MKNNLTNKMLRPGIEDYGILIEYFHSLLIIFRML